MKNKAKFYLTASPIILEQILLSNLVEREAKMKRYQEENCGRVDLQNLLQTKEMVDNTCNSGQLLSCGGVYISREELEPPVMTRFDYVNLQNRSKSILVLKNHKSAWVTKDEEDLFKINDAEEVIEPGNSSDSLKKIFKEHLN